MSEPFVGEIRMFPFKFAPRGWAFCDGQLMAVPQNPALFSLVGTTYGGDGYRTFALPDLRGRAPVHTGIDELGRTWALGEAGGLEQVRLHEWEIPEHTHDVAAAEAPATRLGPESETVLGRAEGGDAYLLTGARLVPMARGTFGPAGGDLPHDNMQPYLTMKFAISLGGIFPQRP